MRSSSKADNTGILWVFAFLVLVPSLAEGVATGDWGPLVLAALIAYVPASFILFAVARGVGWLQTAIVVLLMLDVALLLGSLIG